ncbi:M20 family metallopeptidase [Bacillus horti]|uniref:Peptidase M20 domain-containing protein 2 n=1 Tax=Caldalkalibacillus horti TaxID=77523 RepID=A0ABT9VW92_9BACI|nr:M20 family metallopeptidase [Bacillus horti]MDQ0165243.1 amidohydrolase [Bacillus horti]
MGLQDSVLSMQIQQEIDALRQRFFEISQYIGHHPELGHEEFKAAEILTKELKAHGFQVELGTAGLATAFTAEFDSGKPGPTIGYMCEYDALPGLGHACGHNLIGTMGIASGIGLSKVVEHTGGRVFVYGTPAEETRGGKVTMAEQGLFNHLDVAMMAHPSSHYQKSGSSLAMDAIQFEFHGKAAHAAAAPHEGVNALDAVIQTFNAINALRQHVKPDVRIHGIIPEGGQAANIVPDYAKAQFYVRAASRSYLKEVLQKVISCAEAAALATGATLGTSFYELSYDDMLTNQALSDTFTKQLSVLGISDDEIKEKEGGGSGSIDMGNVSQATPAIHPYIRISQTPIIGHTHEFREAALSSEGFEGMLIGAKALALTGLAVLQDADLLRKIKEEFQSALEVSSI